MSGGIGKEGNALQAPLMAGESPQSKGMCVVKKQKESSVPAEGIVCRNI